MEQQNAEIFVSNNSLSVYRRQNISVVSNCAD